MPELYPWLIAIAIAFMTSAHPAHASGTVSLGSSYTWTDNVAGHIDSSTVSAADVCSITANWYSTHGCAGTTVTSCTDTSITLNRPTCSGAISGSVTKTATGSACPAHSTGTTTCTCDSGYVPDGSGTSCVSDGNCTTAGNVLSSGWYDVGTDPNIANGIPGGSVAACTNGCQADYEGNSISKRALVNGVYHYYAQGQYVSVGGTCSGSDSVPSSLAGGVPADSCGPNNSYIYVNGQMSCMTPSGGAIDPNAVAGTPAVPDSVAQQTAYNAAYAAAQAGGADAATAAAAGQQAAANAAASKSLNPSASIDTSQLATHSDIANQTAAINGKLDELKFPYDDVASKLGTPSTTETIPTDTPTFTADPLPFTTVAGCPAPQTFTLTMPYIAGTYSISWQPFCDFATGIAPLFLTLAAIAAAFIFAAGLTI